jgi:DNA-binding beta-propeller fold protein YncE
MACEPLWLSPLGLLGSVFRVYPISHWLLITTPASLSKGESVMKFRYVPKPTPITTKLFQAALLLALTLLASMAGAAESRRLVTGKQITWPPLGKQRNVGSLPMNIILSPDRKFAITSDMGFRQSVWSINTKTGALVSHLDFPNNVDFSNGLYYGLAFGNASTLYVAQGAHDTIDVVNMNKNGALFEVGSIATKKGDFPAGLATDERGYLYVANNNPSTFAVPTSVAIYSLSTKAEVGRYSFTSSFYGTPNYPLAIAALADGSKTFVTSERDGAVYVLNTSDPANPALAATIATGANPDGLLLNQAQSLLFVANAGSDTVSVVRTSDNAILSTILLRPTRLKNTPGATPTGLGLSPDEQRLYVSMGDMNAIAVLAINGFNLELEGYIPTGWYPTGVVAPGTGLMFTNAKGSKVRYPNPGYEQYQFNSNPDYDLNLIEGNVSVLTKVDRKSLGTWTKMVLANNGVGEGQSGDDPANLAMMDHSLDAIGLKAGKIKHVIYIVKENRTYDQVLGDVPGGNGDPSLVLFGPDVTPNLHALAQRFILLDNFYDTGEASGDGWPWSTQGMANEDVIKNLPYNYSGRGRNYDFEGQNNGYLVGGFPATDPDGKQLSFYFPNGAPAVPDVTEGPGHHIWDSVQAAKLTYRNYGFFYSFGVNDGNGNVILPDNYPAATGIQPPGHDLAGVSDFDFRRYDNDYPDSDAPSQYGCLYARTAYGKYSAPSRFTEWLREFQEMLQKDPTGNSVPAFMTVRFHHDHTQGVSSGKFTPRAEVADNDYAVGQLVEALSKSPIWTNTAVFIIEDDAQDGPDHVDAHRSTAYVISPWIRKNWVDHRFYNTDSILKTMEMFLGLPPLTSYDAIANPIGGWDQQPNNSDPYVATPAAQNIMCEKTPGLDMVRDSDPMRPFILESNNLDFDRPDSAPARILNDIVWKSVKGAHSTPPAPKEGLPGQRSDD